MCDSSRKNDNHKQAGSSLFRNQNWTKINGDSTYPADGHTLSIEKDIEYVISSEAILILLKTSVAPFTNMD